MLTCRGLFGALAFIMVLVPKLPGQKLLIKRMARTMTLYIIDTGQSNNEGITAVTDCTEMLRDVA